MGLSFAADVGNLSLSVKLLLLKEHTSNMKNAERRKLKMKNGTKKNGK